MVWSTVFTSALTSRPSTVLTNATSVTGMMISSIGKLLNTSGSAGPGRPSSASLVNSAT